MTQRIHFTDINETIERYLTALKPLVPDFLFSKSERLAREFIQKYSHKLNSMLQGNCSLITLYTQI